MAIQMELYELKNLCMEMASLGAANSIHSKVLYSRAELMAVDKSEKINSIINK